MKSALLPFIVFAALVPARAIVFTFDTGAQGWAGADNNGVSPYGVGGAPLLVDHHPAGGNPAGYVSITDPSDGDFYFVAPADVLGNQSAAYGTGLSWDLNPSGNTYDPVPDAVLRGAGIELVIDVGPAPTPNVWTHFSVTLSEAGGWRKGELNGPAPTAAEFQAVLADLTGLRLRGEYFAGGLGEEVGALDNVAFAAIPEPAELFGVMSLAFLATAFVRKRLAHQAAPLGRDHAAIETADYADHADGMGFDEVLGKGS